MATNLHVGVNIREGQSVSPIVGVGTGISAIIGTFERGPLNMATLVTSFSQFTRMFGLVPVAGSTSWHQVKAYFAKVGTAPLYVVRVASSAAAKAAKTLQDRQTAAENTIKIEAKTHGVWGTLLAIGIVDSHILVTTPAADVDDTDTSAVLTSVGGLEIGSDIEFDNGTNQEYRRITQIEPATKTVHWSGGLTNSYPAVSSTVTSMEFGINVYDGGVLVEQHSGLSMNDAVSFHCEKKVVSNYITVTDLKTTDTDYEDLPDVTTTPEALTGGADGLADIDADDYKGVQANKTGKYALDAVEELFRFCCPDPVLTDVDYSAAYAGLVQDLLDYANSRVTVQFYADVEDNKTPTQAVTFAGGFEGRRLALFYPWVKVLENRQEIWLPPSVYAMAASVAKDNRVGGPHKSVGNESIAYATDLRYHVSVAEQSVLNPAGVNVLRRMPGRGLLVYGGRTRSAETAWQFLHISEYWNYLGRTLEIATQSIVFEPNNQATWKSTVRRIETFLANEQRKGALEIVDDPSAPAYEVVMNATNNPQDQVAAGIATVTIEYVPIGTIEKLVIEITSSPAGFAISEG